MPILWPLKLPERGNAITQRKTLKIEHSCSFIHHTIWIYMYPFPHLAVILTMLEWMLETPKNCGFCFNNSKTHLFVLYLQNYEARALPILFNTPKKSLLKSSYPKKYLPNFFPKKSENRKFQTQKNPLNIPVTWNPEYPPWVSNPYPILDQNGMQSKSEVQTRVPNFVKHVLLFLNYLMLIRLKPPYCTIASSCYASGKHRWLFKHLECKDYYTWHHSQSPREPQTSWLAVT